jgi:hypothetical protein
VLWFVPRNILYKPTALLPHSRGCRVKLINSLWICFRLFKLPLSNLEQEVAQITDPTTFLRRRLKYPFNLRIPQNAAEVILCPDHFTWYLIKPLHITLMTRRAEGMHGSRIPPKTHRFSRPQLQVMRRVTCSALSIGRVCRYLRSPRPPPPRLRKRSYTTSLRRRAI